MGILKLSILIILIVGSAFWISVSQYVLEPIVSDAKLAELKTLFVTLGGALLAASAIVSSLVLFAMQVNVERMPYGLFRKLSADWKLLCAFGATFFLAILVSGLSLIPKTSAACAIWALFWGLSLTLVLFSYAYRRALTLISPVLQIRFLVEQATKSLGTWSNRAVRILPLLEQAKESVSKDVSQSEYDKYRLIFFKGNPQWTAQAQQAVLHAISFARRYASVLPLWSRLQTIGPEILPSIKEFAEHLANFVKSFANEVACSQGVAPGCQCALIGWSEVPGKLDGYLIEVQPSATSLSIKVEQLQIFGSIPIQTLGNAGNDALQELMVALGKKDKLRREPLQLIRKFVKNDQHDAVGGGVQIGWANSSGFQLSFDVQPLIMGSPWPDMRYRGFDFNEINRIGNAFINLPGLAG